MKLKTNIVIIACCAVLGNLSACNNTNDKPMEMVVNDPNVKKAELNEDVNKKLVMDFISKCLVIKILRRSIVLSEALTLNIIRW